LAFVDQAVVMVDRPRNRLTFWLCRKQHPEPLIMVLQFIGFMMGSNNPTLTNQTSSAIISALLATYATFCLRFSLFLSARRTWKNYAVIRM
jgi:hypothetical protein